MFIHYIPTMELGIQNFTPAGNNLMYRKEWEKYQRDMCESKTRVRMVNRLHYDRIFNGLTDNRSIDVLNNASLKNVKKMDSREFIIKYVQENNGKKSVQEMTEALAMALEIDVKDTVSYRNLFNAVIDEMKMIQNITSGLIENGQIAVSIDGKDVLFEATQQGVKASDNPFSLDGIPSRKRDDETGEIGVAVWQGDNQAASRAFVGGGFSGAGLTDSGDIKTEVPGQFSLPTSLPPPMMPVTFNRRAMPDSNQLESRVRMQLTKMELTDASPANMPTNTRTQTESYYPNPAVSMTPFNVRTSSVARAIGKPNAPTRELITQTAQTGEQGMITDFSQRNAYPQGGGSSYNTYTASGAKVFSPFTRSQNKKGE